MNYEEQTEKEPLSPELEAKLLDIAVSRAPDALASLAAAVSDEEAFVYLPTAAAAAFHLGRFDEAKEFAQRCVALAPSHRESWNHGNALHLGHTVLGLLAIRQGDHEAAIHELRASGETPGSPQLNSFGPTMQLAKSLLRAGHVAPVLAYMQQCRVFWKMGSRWLDLWEQRIREGRVPNFFQHSHV